jgi:4-carboxymuconolactone decarboxylase
MARLDPLKPEEMNAEQRATFEKAKASGGRLGGPNGIYIRVPELFELHQGIGNHLLASACPPRMRQMAIIVAARYWNAEYPWAVQARAALNMGIERAIVDAINEGRRPAFTSDDDALAYDLASELMRRGGLSDESFKKGETRLGFNGLMDFVAVCGFYTSVALVTNVYKVDAPADIPVPLAK